VASPPAAAAPTASVVLGEVQGGAEVRPVCAPVGGRLAAGDRAVRGTAEDAVAAETLLAGARDVAANDADGGSSESSPSLPLLPPTADSSESGSPPAWSRSPRSPGGSGA